MDVNLKLKEAEIRLTKEDDRLYNFGARKISTLSNTEYQKFLQMFNKAIKGKKMNVIHSSYEKETVNLQFLSKSALEFDFGKHLFKKNLDNFKHQFNDEFIYKPSNCLSEKDLLLFVNDVADKKDINGSSTNFIKELKETAGFNYDENKWKIVYKDKDLIGLVFPQLYPDDTKEGTLLHIGILPKYRNLGYGKIIHSKGIEYLKEYGAKTYIGSTKNFNKSMIKVFEINNCEFSYYQFYYSNS